MRVWYIINYVFNYIILLYGAEKIGRAEYQKTTKDGEWERVGDAAD